MRVAVSGMRLVGGIEGGLMRELEPMDQFEAFEVVARIRADPSVLIDGITLKRALLTLMHNLENP